jgi:hypothetical protein
MGRVAAIDHAGISAGMVAEHWPHDRNHTPGRSFEVSERPLSQTERLVMSRILSRGAALTILAAAALIGPTAGAFAQQTPGQGGPMSAHPPGMMQHDHQAMMAKHGQAPSIGSAPVMPGQDAFGAIQEIVKILEADPKTDWSKVNLEALRQHLIDMNEVTLRAGVAAKPVDGGLEMVVTGEGRTLGAIQRMVPAHGHELSQMNGWSAKTDLAPNGVRLVVTSSDPREAAHIRGLGFIGLLVSGSHHQVHHLAIARGELSHQH